MVKVIVLTGYGINCEQETKHAFELAGASANIVHLTDLIAAPKSLDKYQIMAIPGGFSFGDDTGSGKAYANEMKNHLSLELKKFIVKDKLIIGICNGFQILTHLELLPGALVHNQSARYSDRWVDLKIENNSPWLTGIKTLSVPIAHGEGKYYVPEKILTEIKKKNMIALKYIKGDMCKYQNLPANPNGSIDDIAGVTDKTGKILGLMPHPDRAIFFNELPNWPLLKEKYLREGKEIPKFGPGLPLFQNAVDYFSKR